jgi:2-polyprenyl-3-methyl-5-hydroxy-6-metoxy-1,4-benzoquinol methylase
VSQGSRPRRLLVEALARLGPVRDGATGTVMWLKPTRSNRLLDVGCGSGSFLARMRDLGWDVHGVEPDPVAARVAMTRYQLDVACVSLQDAALPSESFDVVTMSHVLEHAAEC